MRKILGTVLISVLLLIAVTAQAEGTVNVQGLKAIKHEDTFGVHITRIQIIPGADQGNAEGGNDFLHLTIQNNTDCTVSAVRIYFMAYNETHQQIFLGDNVYGFSLEELQPQACSKKNMLFPAKSSYNIGFYCDADSLIGVQAIVASYTINSGDSGSTVISNPNADIWFSSAYTDGAPEATE